MLTGVQGVGSKMALAVLSALSIEELQRACAGGDAAMVARAQGVGPSWRHGSSTNSRTRRERCRSRRAVPGWRTRWRRVRRASDAVSALQNPGFSPRWRAGR